MDYFTNHTCGECVDYARRAADERTISLNNKSNKKGNK